MDANKILEALHSNSITLRDLIDTHIDSAGIIGVGLITLKEQLGAIVDAHHRPSVLS